MKTYQPSGVLIMQVSPNSPAEQAGLQAGDIIEFFDDQSVSDVRTLSTEIAGMKPGAQATVRVIRNGIWQTFTVSIGAAPKAQLATPRFEPPVASGGMQPPGQDTRELEFWKSVENSNDPPS